MKTRRSAFTLMEILTVIAIIALLIGIVLPVYSHAQRAGIRADTVSNLRQIGLQLAMYESDYDGMPRTFEVLQASNYKLPDAVFVAKADPFRKFGTMVRDCFAPGSTVATSYEHNLDWPDHMRQELESYDANHGLVATRVYGERTEFFARAQSRFCDAHGTSFEGVLLRLRKDTSVQTAKFSLHWKVQPGSTKLSPMFAVHDLYTDGFPSKIPW